MCVYIYVCVYICKYVCVCVCIYIYIYIYILNKLNRLNLQEEKTGVQRIYEINSTKLVE
jgi:hypothetical protein